MRPERLLVFAAVVALGAACPARMMEPPPPVVVIMETPDAGGVATSARGNLRFKGPERLTNDFAAALSIPVTDLCAELGQYPCAAVHTIALGGVDPYGKGLYETPGITAVTTPLVVDRVAWSACAKRVELDLVSPSSAVLFRSVPMTGPKLTNPEGGEVAAVIGLLTQRALQRDAYANEVARYVKLAKDIEASGNAEPARAWMQSVCFAVLSSAESVFY